MRENLEKSMLSIHDRQIADELKRRIKQDLADVELMDFRVYGSRARGDFTPDSDMDVFLEVVSISKEQRLKISEIAWEVGFEMDRVISTFVVTIEQINNGPLAANPILSQIEHEGIRL